MRRQFFWVWVGLVCLSGFVMAEEGQPAGQSENLAALVASTAASVPRLIQYSSAVKDAQGEPVRGVAVRLTFSIYSEPQGGTPLWTERQVVELDEQGRYAAFLGAASAGGIAADLFAPGKTRWLGVQVESREEEPRVLLVSVPYAMKAEDAEKLGGRKATDFVLAEQLKEEVKTAVSLQVLPVEKSTVRPQAALTSPTTDSPAITGGQSSLTCNTTTPCVTVTESSTGAGVQASAKTLGLYGIATQPTGVTNAVYGRNVSTTGRGVLGQAAAATGATQGVYGLAASTLGVGVFADATAATGATRGVYARTKSTTGVGVWADATAGTGATTGVMGRNYSATGVGVYGQALGATGIGVLGYATKTSGAITGVLARVASAAGTALIADNTAGGNIFLGKVGSDVKFSVDGSGNVVATSFTGDGSGLTGIPSSAGGTVTSIDSGTGLLGGPITTTGILSVNPTVVPLLAADNYFTGYQSIAGGLGVSGEIYGASAYFDVNGVYSLSQDYPGVIGESPTTDGVQGYGYYSGVYGQTDAGGFEFNSGVWGDGYYDGVYGYGETDAGVYGESPVYGVYGYSDPAAGGTAVFAEGDIAYTGTIGQVTLLASNRVVSLNAMQSPENWSEDFGSGQLQNGAAAITLDLTFAETVNTQTDYHVFLTPKGDCEGLYIANTTPDGFTVRELKGGKSNVAFDYRIVARRRGYETVRLRQIEADEEVVAKLRAQTAAASSAKSPKLTMSKRHEPPRRSARSAARRMRPARSTMMRTPRMPKGLELLQTPLGRNLVAPTR